MRKLRNINNVRFALRNINDVRFAIFQQKYASRKRDAPHNKIIGINPSSMPPVSQS